MKKILFLLYFLPLLLAAQPTPTGNTKIRVVEGNNTWYALLSDLLGVRPSVDSTFAKISGSYTGKRITDNVYKTGTLGVRTTDTTGVLNVKTISGSKTGQIIEGTTSDGITFIKAKPTGYTGLTTLGSFNLNGRRSAGVNSPYSSRPNYVWNLGYNYADNVTREVAHEAAFGLGFETYYQNAALSSGSTGFMEYHERFTDTFNVEHRWFSAIEPWDGAPNKAGVTWTTDYMVFRDHAGNETWDYNPMLNLWDYTDTTQLRFSEPRGFALSALNGAAGAYMNLLDFNGTDTFEIARNNVPNTRIHSALTLNNGQMYSGSGGSINVGSASRPTQFNAFGNTSVGSSGLGARLFVYNDYSSTSAAGSDAWAVMHLRNRNSTNNNWSAIQFNANGGTIAADMAVQYVNQSSAYGDIVFHNRGSSTGYGEALRITSEKRLGVRTNNPQRDLHVAGEVRITDLTTDAPTRIVGADADGDIAELPTSSELTIASGTLKLAQQSATSGQVLEWNGSAWAPATDDGAGLTGSGANTQLAYWTGTSSLAGSSNLLWDGTTHTITGKGALTFGGSYSSSQNLYNMSGTVTSTANSLTHRALYVQPVFANDGTTTNQFYTAGSFSASAGSSTAATQVIAVSPNVSNTSPNVSQLIGVNGRLDENSASGNLSNRYGLDYLVVKGAQDATDTHTGTGIRVRMQESTTSGRWSVGTGAYIGVENAVSATGVNVQMSNAKGTGSTQYGLSITNTASGSGVSVTDAIGARFIPAETSSGSITNYYGIFNNTSPVATTSYMLYNSTDYRNYLNGNLAIGVDATTAKLFVRGSGTTSGTAGLIVEKSDGTDYLFGRDDGKIGIGNSAPARELHVTGEVRITDLTTDDPTKIVGADADGDLGGITVGSGLSLSAGTLTATGGSGGHTIRDDGADETARTALNFVSTSTINAVGTDDAGNNETEIALNIPTDGVTATEIAAGAVGTSEIATDGVGSAELQAESVIYAKIQNVAANSLMGNPTGGANDPTDVGLGAGLGFSSGNLVNTGDTDGTDDAPIGASYITTAGSLTLTSERTATMGVNMAGTDAGANTTFTFDALARNQTTSQYTGDQDNLNPTNWSTRTTHRVSGDGTIRAITGFVDLPDGTIRRIVNNGSSALYIPAGHPDSDVGHRVAGRSDQILAPGGIIEMYYSGPDSMWQITSNTFNPANMLDAGVVGHYYSSAAGSTVAADWGALAFQTNGGANGQTAPTSTLPGAWSLNTSTSSTGSANLYYSDGLISPSETGAAHLVSNCAVYIPTLSDGTQTYTAQFSIGATPNSNSLNNNNAVGIRYSNGINSGKFEGFSRNNSGTESTVDLGITVAANTNYVLTICFDKARTEARFYINGAYSGRVTGNMPSAVDAGPRIGLFKSAGTTAREIDVAMFNFYTIY